MPGFPAPFARMALVPRRVHQKRERRLEHVRDLDRIDRQRQIGRHDRHDRHDAIAGAGQIGVEIADRIGMMRRQADLLPRFA